MHFSVIYSFDVRRNQSVVPWQPKAHRTRWNCTEGDEQFEFEYLGDNCKGGKHRKYCAILTRSQFDEFVSDMGLVMEDVETMGSLGAPGCGFGLAPAVSFHREWGGHEDEPIWCNAYVTPIPDFKPRWERFDLPLLGEEGKAMADEHRERRSEQIWQRIRDAMLSVYGS
jgi:hypothetical protein